MAVRQHKQLPSVDANIKKLIEQTFERYNKNDNEKTKK